MAGNSSASAFGFAATPAFAQYVCRAHQFYFASGRRDSSKSGTDCQFYTVPFARIALYGVARRTHNISGANTEHKECWDLGNMDMGSVMKCKRIR